MQLLAIASAQGELAGCDSDVNFIFKEKAMYAKIFSEIKRFIRDEDGATAVEYGLLAALIAVVMVVAVTSVGKSVCETFRSIATTLGGKPAACPT